MVKKIVLAYSGGLDTSIILKWLQDTYNAEVITFTADIGQGEEIEPARKKAEEFGVSKIYIEDLKEEFVRDYVFPMFRANTVYEGTYLLGTSIARPLIAKRQIEIAKECGADSVSHGATGKGNDQVRFELGYYGLNPKINVIAPWREWDLNSRTKLLAYAKQHNIPIAKDKENEAPYSMDANLLHISYEGNILEDPWASFDPTMLKRTNILHDASNEIEEITIDFENGDPIAINNTKLSPATLLDTLNKIGGKHGIGILDIVENRFVGIKSRGVYETPGGTILMSAHRAIESVTLDKKTMHKKDEIMPKYAELIYNGYWYSKERFKLQKIVDLKRNKVNGTIKLKLYKGNITIQSRKTNSKAYSMKKVSFEENKSFNKSNVERFINLHKKMLRS